jgi:hypothetical protein
MADVTVDTDEVSRDEPLGYQDGQRTAKANPYLSGRGLKTVGHRRQEDASRALNLNKRLFLKGFKRGYRDELAGTAQPLPEEGESS